MSKLYRFHTAFCTAISLRCKSLFHSTDIAAAKLFHSTRFNGSCLPVSCPVSTARHKGIVGKNPHGFATLKARCTRTPSNSNGPPSDRSKSSRKDKLPILCFRLELLPMVGDSARLWYAKVVMRSRSMALVLAWSAGPSQTRGSNQRGQNLERCSTRRD